MSIRCVEVQTDPPYRVHVGRGALESVGSEQLLDGGLFVLADQKAWSLHGRELRGLDSAPRLEIEGGEGAKTLDRLAQVLDAMAGAGLSRASTVITFGGGSIGDLGGLAASVFKRGVKLVHCPTTLLAQVDASVGGKTAVNLLQGKNLAGTIYQPRAVFADPHTLSTLPAEERASGLGEVLKTAVLGGETLLTSLETGVADLLRFEPETTTALVAACVETKATIVSEDPLEQGPRRALNLGHTFAHAIEHCAGYGAVPHGIAVSVGLTLALQASAATGLLEDPTLPRRVQRLQQALALPATLSELSSAYDLDPAGLLVGLAHDKKGSVGQPEFVLVRRPGAAALGVVLDNEVLQSLLA